MQEINFQNALHNIPSDIDMSAMSEDDYQEWLCEQENARRIERKDPFDFRDDCPLCGNKGQVLRWDRELQMRTVSTCKCEYTRRSLEVLSSSGVCSNWEEKTLQSFRAVEPWQRSFKKNIAEYISNGKGWLYVAGQSGCGKTHLCTAAFAELVKDGRFGRYVTWLSLMQKLEAAYYSDEAYQDVMKPLTNCRVLYLDDLFKGRNNADVSAREFAHTMRLLNARYQRAEDITIISSEWRIERLAAFDEALAGRVVERCGRHIIQIARAEGRNYRFSQVKSE